MSKQKSALGRGLSALLPDRDELDATQLSGIGTTKLYNFDERIRTAGTISEVDIHSVLPNPYQPREHFDETALAELSASIRELGIIQPITVRTAGPNRFELISGERRLKAARMAGITRIPAYIREADREAMLEMALVENVQREQLNPIEIALGYRRLIDECSLTQEDVASKIGKNRSTVANFLRLLKLPPLIQAGLRDGILSTGHARALLSLENEDLQRQILDEIVKNDLSVRDVEKRVREALRPVKKKADPLKELSGAHSVELSRISERIRRMLGTKVTVKPGSNGKGGKIEVEYYSNEDLERIVEFFDR
ncbi:MAG: ParB/RepB/Spo0J family partition protein [Bacteroidetes bacterium]|nr:ParB/RepB/Spo0J family partition protein [Bacteroidota bacterium]